MNRFEPTGSAIVGALFAVSCATTGTHAREPIAGSDFTVSSNFNDAEAKAWVEIHSLAKKPLCMSRVDWPNSFGAIGDGAATVVSGNVERNVVSDFNYGSCIGDQCFLRIEPGQTLRGFISYNEFGDPSIIKALPNKDLKFSPQPTFCRRS